MPTVVLTDTLCVYNLAMPLSVNKAYVSIGRGRRKLSTEGKIYKRMLVDTLAPHVTISNANIFSGIPLELHITLYFKSIENKGWPKKTKERYKRVDVSNRVKLLEDALFDSLGLDDKLIFSLRVTKTQSSSSEEH